MDNTVEIPIVTVAHAFGDHIDTDRIIAGKYTKTLDRSVLASHLFEDLAPNFHNIFKPGDCIVAGEGFGCGSSREQAAIALAAAGVSCVIARSFARIFFRNAINIGLPVFEVTDHTIKDQSLLEVFPRNGLIVDQTAHTQYQTLPMPKIIGEICEAGGLVEYLKERRDFNDTP